MGKEQEQGRFIVFEGVDGSGKSTQVELLANFLQEKGCKVILTWEPGGGSEELRKLILDPEVNRDTRIALCLFLADRRLHLLKVVNPARKKGFVVISDRYEASTLAYQGLAGDLPFGKVEEFNTFITEGVKPDLTIFVDLPVEEAMSRRTKSGQRLTHYDAREIDFHRRLQEGYHRLASQEENWVVIDGRGSIEDVHQKVLEVLAERKILS